MLHRMPKDFTKNFWRNYNAAIKSGDLGIARSVAYRAINFYLDENDNKHAGIWQRVLANVFYLQGNYDQAVIEGKLAMEAFESNPYETALTCVALAGFHATNNEFDRAFELFDKAAEIGRDFHSDGYLWTHLFGSRALAHRRTGNCDKAIIDMEGAADLLQQEGQFWRAALYINNIGYLLTIRGETDQAEDRFLRALELVEQDPHPHTRAAILDSLGYLCTLTNRFQEAETHLERSIKIFENLDDRSQLLGSLLHLSQLRRRQLFYEEASDLALRSLDLAREVKSESLIAEAREAMKAIALDQAFQPREDLEPVYVARRNPLRVVTPLRRRQFNTDSE
ncbi:MAG: hypothetical protein DMF61_10755 [Blastocatellia bacterium AA13]|nr:MAG: hypothetical protein DMF61_10755 [Blastocatellia bacterium AA13]